MSLLAFSCCQRQQTPLAFLHLAGHFLNDGVQAFLLLLEVLLIANQIPKLVDAAHSSLYVDVVKLLDASFRFPRNLRDLDLLLLCLRPEATECAGVCRSPGSRKSGGGVATGEG